MTRSASGFGFGQTERLTRRIAGLIRSYRPGVGILKEFLQNADDAGATELRVVLDLQTHPGDQLPDSRMGPLCGPALLLRNNARFTRDDLTAIRRISESSKYHSGPKTGRFGLGFNTAYNVTDHPGFVTNDATYCFDPHQDTVAQGVDHGRGWLLTEAWVDFPDWPRLFAPGGLADDCEDLDGTIFRLPFRPEGRISEVCDRPFGAAEARAIFAEAAEAGSTLLLFTRNLESLTIEEIDDAGQREVLRIELIADEAFRAARAALNSAVQGDLRALISTWLATDGPLPSRLCSSTWRVTTPSSVREEHWRVYLGLARGTGDRLLKAAQDMMAQGEKAVPWIGVAARLDGARALPVSGNLYCGLPLPVANEQPVHINGYFDLDSSRQHLTSVGDASGAAIEARLGWNAALLEEGIAAGWVALLADLASRGVEDLYSLFPAVPANNEPLARMVRRAYDELAGMAVIRASASGGTRLVRPKDLRLPASSARTGLFEPLAAEGLPMPSPTLPAAVEANFGKAIGLLSPTELRELLRMSPDDIDCVIAEAPRPILRQRAWIERLLAYALSDGSKDLSGLPLLILSDGRLHTIGAKLFCLASDELRALFPGKPEWFVDPSFASETGLGPVPEVKLRRMELGLVIANLSVVLGKDPVRDWAPEELEPPNSDWLRRLLDYIARHELNAHARTKLAELPLFPGSDGRLYSSCHAHAPLVVAKDDAKPALLTALRKLDVVVLDEHVSLARELRELLHRVPEFLQPLDGPRLADALYERRGEVDVLEEVASPLLDYLAEPRWTYTTVQQQRLRALPLFPSDRGTIALNGSRVFLPSQFRAPDLALDVCLLCEERRWGRLYEKLGVEEIDASGYLKNALLPALADLTPHDRHRALEWLRDNLLPIAARLGDDEAKIRRRIGAIPLVLGMDESLHPISELHDPDSKIVREVLESEAIYPDMSRYASRRDGWLAFFRNLGLIRELSKARIVRHVQTMAARGLEAAGALKRVFRYLDETLSEEASAEILTALRPFAWLPARQASKASGFVAPDDRLYQPGELALNDRLVGSQLPVADWTPQRSATVVALGIIRAPAASVVLEHFQYLLDASAGQGLADESARGLGNNFQEIYRYLDHFCAERPARGEPRLMAHDVDLISEIAAEPCIWDPRTARLWPPADVFAVPVPFFDPLRTSVHLNGGERFLARLGRRNAPSSGDFAAFLEDLQSLAAGARLDDAQRRQAIHALNAVANDTEGTLPLLTSDGRLVDSTDLYWDDAPWLRGRLGDGLAIAALDVPTPLLDGLAVRRLSVEVEEKIAHIERHGVTPGAVSACANLARRVASPQFSMGLERLVRHEHGADAGVTAPQLAIEPVARVEVELVLAKSKSLGRAEVTQYFDDSRPCLYLVGSSEGRMVKWVAQAVSRLLGSNALQSTAASLEHILACEPAEIDAVLNEDRVPRIVSDVAEIEWPAEPVDDVPQPGDGSQHDGRQHDDSEHDGSQHENNDRQGSGQRRDAMPVHPSAAHNPGRRVGAGEPGQTFVPETDEPGRSPMPVPSGPYGATVHASGPRVASDALWTGASASRPPVEPGDGVSRTRRDGVGSELPNLESESDDADEAKQEIEERAIEISLRHELGRGRSPERMPDKNPGHDIQSRDENADIRYIEVKGIAGDWRNHPIRLTPTQFEQAHALRDGYWLYVVERVAGTPRLHCIRDPAQHILGFAVDAKWARFAEAAPSIVTPKEGLLLLEQMQVLGTITRVKGAAGLFRVSYRAKNGIEITLTFQPGKHSLKDTAHGTNGP